MACEGVFPDAWRRVEPVIDFAFLKDGFAEWQADATFHRLRGRALLDVGQPRVHVVLRVDTRIRVGHVVFVQLLFVSVVPDDVEYLIPLEEVDFKQL